VPPVQIVVAEDHPEFRALLSEQLGLEPDLKVIGEARDGFEAVVAVARLAPDVLTLDLDLPGLSGLEVLEVVRWCSPNTKVIILSGHDEEETVLEALRLGARGYIVKAEGTNPVKAVRAVQRGEVWARRWVLARVLEELIGVADLTFPATGGEPAPA
jgi:DNA-binding NarL/FixJ family response regulator